MKVLTVGVSQGKEAGSANYSTLHTVDVGESIWNGYSGDSSSQIFLLILQNSKTHKESGPKWHRRDPSAITLGSQHK